MGRRKIDPIEAARLRTEGWSLQRLADRYKVSGPSAVAHAIKRNIDEVRAAGLEYHGHDEPSMRSRRKEVAYAAGSAHSTIGADGLPELFYLYHVEELSMQEIGDEFGVHERTIGRYLNGRVHHETTEQLIAKYGKPDPSRWHPPKAFDDDKIREAFRLYHDLKYTIPMAASALEVSTDVIHRTLTGRYGILSEELLKTHGPCRMRTVIEPEQIPEIFKRYYVLRESQSRIGIDFDVNQATIGNLLRGEIETLSEYVDPLIAQYGLPSDEVDHIQKEEGRLRRFVRELVWPMEVIGDRQRSEQPAWLGRQRFDIWVPELKMAVEYHGSQHFEPIEWFGGQSKFEERQINDQRKRELAAANGVLLVEIAHFDPLDLASIRLRLENALTASGRPVPWTKHQARYESRQMKLC